MQIDSNTGLVKRMDVGVYQRGLFTREGLHRASTRAELIAMYGEPDRYEAGEPLATYEYKRGLEVWISVERVYVEPATGALRLFKPRPLGQTNAVTVEVLAG